MDDLFTELENNSTRPVLTEIPIRFGALSPDPLHDISRTDQHFNIRSQREDHPSYMRPVYSGDEIIIRQRGRRYLPITFSPDTDSNPELDSDSNKNSIILKSPPRKKLLYDPSEPSSPVEIKINELNPKPLCPDQYFELPEDKPLLTAMKALTIDQLIGIIDQMVIDYPDAEKKIRTRFPAADIRHLDDRIHDLGRNIYRAPPSNREILKTDPASYNQVSMHVIDFKRYVIDEGRRLAEINQWPIVMDYVFMAWKHVCHTPVWDNPSHNATRIQCFKSLASLCLMALKHLKDTLDNEKREKYKKQLNFIYNDCKDEVEVCLKFLLDQ